MSTYLESVKKSKSKRKDKDLVSMENMDRASPELFPENFPEILEYSDELNKMLPSSQYLSQLTEPIDEKKLLELCWLPPEQLINEIKHIHDVAYQLGIEEAKEMTRAKYLKVLNKKHKTDPVPNAKNTENSKK